MKNIEDRYSAGGATKHHTPGAGTTRGDSEDVAPRGDERNESSGMGSKEWKEKFSDQLGDVSSSFLLFGARVFGVGERVSWLTDGFRNY